MAQAAVPLNLADEVLALDVQLEEYAVLLDRQKGKQRAGEASAAEQDIAQIQSELEGRITFLRDLILAHSIARAVHTDADQIARLVEIETQEARDRQSILHGSGPAEDIQPAEESEILTEQATNSRDGGTCSVALQLEHLGVDDAHESCSQYAAGPSISYADRQTLAIEKLSQRNDTCVACYDKFARCNTIQASCGHRYCKECIKQLFARSAKDETLFPPRCCRQQIPLEVVSTVMTKDEIEVFELAELEFATMDKVYCCEASCGKFIAPSQIDHEGKATCHFCETQTCSHCKAAFHQSDCAQDPELQLAVAVAEREGWKRCPRCQRFVELAYGCNHITCRCGSEWCYQCRELWKTCRCAQWEEERLLFRAQQVVDRDAAAPLAELERARLVQVIENDLLARHECNHPGRFERVTHGAPNRGHRCEMCDSRHYKYILRCRRCHLQVCEDCRRHRV